MDLIMCFVVFNVLLVVLFGLALLILLQGSGRKNSTSKYVINKFEPDNTAPKITDLVEFHKKSEQVKYNVK